MTCTQLSMTINPSFLYFLDSIYFQSTSPYLYLSRHVVSVSNCPKKCLRNQQQYRNKGWQKRQVSINSMHIVELLQIYCHSLDFPGLTNNEGQNRLICHCIRKGIVLFVFFSNKNVAVYIMITSKPNFKALYCISFIPGTSPFLVLVRLIFNPQLFLNLPLHRQLFEKI